MAYTTISKSSDYFNTKLYTGNSSTQNITGLDFQPDWVAIKDRDATNSFMTFDAVRGATELLNWNTTNAQSTQTPTLTSFNSDGFSIGNNTALNTNGNDLVAWNWKANGVGSANTDGSITATLSANSTSGFSISTFTTPGSGTFTVGHGLGVAPKMIIYRPTGSSSWQVGHNSIGWTNFLTLNSTSASSASTAFGNTAPTTSYWTGNTANVGANAPCVAYCFADVQGYSKFGKFTGNGSTDGTFVYTGFKPAFVIIKNISDSSNEWNMFDNKRDSFNVITKRLVANGNSADAPSTYIDFLSNGIKCRTSNNLANGSGLSYIYMAFAEAPLVGTNNVPCTAK